MTRFQISVRLKLEVPAENLPDAWATIHDILHPGRRLAEADESRALRIIEAEIDPDQGEER